MSGRVALGFPIFAKSFIFAGLLGVAACEQVIVSPPVSPTPVTETPVPTPTVTPTPDDVPTPVDTPTALEPGEEIQPGENPDPVDAVEPPTAEIPDAGDIEAPLVVDPTPVPSPVPTVEPEPTPTSEPIPEPTPTETPELEPAFYYYPPGDLEPNSGEGHADLTIYVPDMVFPIRDAPSYPQSQVYRFGGGVLGGDQCDPRNFSYPWRDNYCEKRSRDNGTPYCPLNRVHLGQDIRVGTPEGCQSERRTDPSKRAAYAVVAAEDGIISNIGRYTVTLRSGGRIYRYMHMNMRALQVSVGDSVEAGDKLGYVSNDFGGTPTTFHLHFEIKHNTREAGWTWAPPYTSLIAAYERREGAPGRLVETDEDNMAAIASAP